jgi:hypothetical protein
MLEAVSWRSQADAVPQLKKRVHEQRSRAS